MTPISWQRLCTAIATPDDEPPVTMMAPSLLDHALGAVAGGVRLGLRVAGDVGDLLAEDAVALERRRLQRLDHAAVALAVEVLDGELIGLQLVGAFVGIRTGLRHVEAESDRVARRVVAEFLSPCALAEHQRRCCGGEQGRACSLENLSTAEAVKFGHSLLLLLRNTPAFPRRRDCWVLIFSQYTFENAGFFWHKLIF